MSLQRVRMSAIASLLLISVLLALTYDFWRVHKWVSVCAVIKDLHNLYPYFVLR